MVKDLGETRNIARRRTIRTVEWRHTNSSCEMEIIPNLRANLFEEFKEVGSIGVGDHITSQALFVGILPAREKQVKIHRHIKY